MKILVTGANGQLGREVVHQFNQNYEVIGYGKDELDISNLDRVSFILKKDCPDVIIHSAAYTAVDECETQGIKAIEINGLGAANVARAARKIGARMFYISTDYVFNGEKEIPYLENDKTNPLSMYGLSKLVGELMVQTILPNSTIIRTSWLYGHDGKNFVKTMIHFARENKKVRVVNDQVGSPTYTADLVEIINVLLEKPNGIYHVSNTGTCSWYQFAKRIYKEAGSDPELVTPCTTEEYGALAKRPKFSVMDHGGLKSKKVPLPRKWEVALQAFMKREFFK
ncbi:dTDP-4-dehydrorhamnose reductase [Neobacillus bataviensis]|uniref:dTDP-4-dehydrorhamnose reductase n=1 Tax=Neobacillus bataviensis TaxID=220685 RepID=UPI001CBD653F|nr:dTDP-4-dehydrorhamnose reductase [Neobacillus bataviensis]